MSDIDVNASSMLASAGGPRPALRATDQDVKVLALQLEALYPAWPCVQQAAAMIRAQAQEIADLRHDLERYVQRDSEQLAEIFEAMECIQAADAMRIHFSMCKEYDAARAALAQRKESKL